MKNNDAQSGGLLRGDRRDPAFNFSGSRAGSFQVPELFVRNDCGRSLPSRSIKNQPMPRCCTNDPALIQELTLVGRHNLTALGGRRSRLMQILFSFYNGALYRMLVTYEDSATKGLTDDDMIRIVSAKYGVATRPLATVVCFPDEPVVQGQRKSHRAVGRFAIFAQPFSIYVRYVCDRHVCKRQLDAQAAISIAESERIVFKYLCQNYSSVSTTAKVWGNDDDPMNRLWQEWWRRGESNPRPKSATARRLHAYRIRFVSPAALGTRKTRCRLVRLISPENHGPRSAGQPTV